MNADAPPEQFAHDVFLSHATEDKQPFVLDLCQALRNLGLRVWIDEHIHVGDAIGTEIDAALLASRYAVVVFSRPYLTKVWTQRELEGVLAIEGRRKTKFLLPVWHGLPPEDLANHKPTLSLRRGIDSKFGSSAVARHIADAVQSAPGQVADALRTVTLEELSHSAPSASRSPRPADVLELLDLVTQQNAQEQARRALLQIGWESIGAVVLSVVKQDRDAQIEICRRGLAAFRADPQILLIVKRVIQAAEGRVKRTFLELRDRKRLEFEEAQLRGLHERGWRYRVERPLGQGLHARTYLAHDTRDADFRVVLRILRPEYAADDEIPRRYLGTAARSRRYHQENLLVAHDSDMLRSTDEHPTMYFVAREYVEGPSLKRMLENGQRLEWRRVVKMAPELVRALHPLHEDGLAHCGLKPANVLFNAKAIALLADPGVGRGGSVHLPSFDWVYCAPEMVLGHAQGKDRVSPAADFYSLGCVLFEALTGRPLCTTEDIVELAAWHGSNAPIAIDALPADVPAKLRMILIGLLARDPAQRLTDPSRLLQVLDALAAMPQARVPLPPPPIEATRPPLSLRSTEDDQAWTGLLALARERAERAPAPTQPPPQPDAGRTITCRPGERPPSESNEPVTGGLPENGKRSEASTTFGGSWTGVARGDVSVGSRLGGKYRIVRVLGKGGFGTVYSGVDEILGADVAIKILAPGIVREHGQEVDVLHEARLLCRIDHPNVVRLLTVDRTPDGLLYMVMELLRGHNLAEVISAEGRLRPVRAANILYQILCGLRAAHELSPSECLLHLDVKPQNVYLDGPAREERAKLLDFGIGALRAPRGVGGIRAATPAYASPEQLRWMLDADEEWPVDHRSDLFSLGVTGYHMLTGKLPQADSEIRTLARMRTKQQIAKIRTVSPDVPRLLASFIDRCLALHPHNRWPTTRDAIAGLEKYQKHIAKRWWWFR